MNRFLICRSALGGVRLFCSNKTIKRNTNVNFSLSDSDSDSEDVATENNDREKKEWAIPPPYNPFNKQQPVVFEDPEDPKDLQHIFHRMRSEGGLLNNAAKMFDALSKDGLTHEALQLFSQIKDEGHMPDVVAYTAVMEAYFNAGTGHSKEALKVFMRMLASGIVPNAYSYSVLITGLAVDAKLVDAKKYVLEMMAKGMRPNAHTYAAVFEAFTKENKVEEAKVLLQQMKDKGFVPDEKAVRDALSNKRGQVFRTVIGILFDKI
ncbi:MITOCHONDRIAL GROUP I INTRON SPLICING FACTOR CCM1 [Salix koriyanagi]|uniref:MITOCHONDRIAL GROUP I INTRON SPLICING FACTOR CCM1 n=2 Tax=Salix TaxID=40685 RepID=A0A9Q0VYW5_9ROSI|nr:MITOCHONDRIAL GROUP I INTRON SPLICING FACTOR CCM1 [Salix koriyanagi]